jgi:hypothetical protein
MNAGGVLNTCKSNGKHFIEASADLAGAASEEAVSAAAWVAEPDLAEAVTQPAEAQAEAGKKCLSEEFLNIG